MFVWLYISSEHHNILTVRLEGNNETWAFRDSWLNCVTDWFLHLFLHTFYLGQFHSVFVLCGRIDLSRQNNCISVFSVPFFSRLLSVPSVLLPEQGRLPEPPFVRGHAWFEAGCMLSWSLGSPGCRVSPQSGHITFPNSCNNFKKKENWW